MSEEYNGRLQSINNYKVYKIPPKVAKDYITKYHYTHGCSNVPHPCYGLFYKQYNLIGVLMFATPCSEDVRINHSDSWSDSVLSNQKYLQEHGLKSEIQCLRLDSLFRKEYLDGTIE